jgi:hypothetical protein
MKENPNPDGPRAFEWIDDFVVPPMTGNPFEDADQQFVHGLLTSYFESDDERENRISRVLARFDNDQPAPGFGLKNSGMSRWITLSTAAMIILCLSSWICFQPSEALAALSRTLKTVEQNVTRIYEVRAESRTGQSIASRRALLTTHSGNEFVVEITDSPVQTLIGSNSKEQWVVRGERLWRSSDGNPFRPRELLLHLMTARQMNLNAMLTQIPGNYDIEVLPAQTIPGYEDLKTNPLLATLKTPNLRNPETIKFWPHPITRVAVRLELTMPRTLLFGGSNTIVADLKDEQPFAPETFEHSTYCIGCE